LHDIGKLTPYFQQRILEVIQSSEGENVEISLIKNNIYNCYSYKIRRQGLDKTLRCHGNLTYYILNKNILIGEINGDSGLIILDNNN